MKAANWSTFWPDEINERETHKINPEVKLFRMDKTLDFWFLVIRTYVSRWIHKAEDNSLHSTLCNVCGVGFRHTNTCVYCHLGTVRGAWQLPPETGESFKMPVNSCHLQGILNQRGHPNQHQMPTWQVGLLLTFFAEVPTLVCFPVCTCTQICSKVPAESRTKLSLDCCTTHIFCKSGVLPWQSVHKCFFKVT